MNSQHKFAFYRSLVGMECRKDILSENEVINKKNLKRVTPAKERFRQQIKSNKMRLAYFLSFCVVFNLQPVYDALIYGNSLYPWLEKKFSFAEVPETVTEQHRITIPRNDKTQKLGQLFLKLDKNCSLTPKFMQSLKNPANQSAVYPYDYVDVTSWIEFFSRENVSDVEERIRAKYYMYIN